jgi:hypothetical protein
LAEGETRETKMWWEGGLYEDINVKENKVWKKNC